ncbi:hypothetical protein Tco_1053577 [Tanacetum coccineum]|uniref:Uncharacterized protein n=1 Tax=Tanacetum coccineum TaxID=301880 RepID=A0ABQ5GUB4_9ASTR
MLDEEVVFEDNHVDLEEVVFDDNVDLDEEMVVDDHFDLFQEVLVWYQSLVALDLGLIRFGSSYDDQSWFGKGYIYRNCILPIFLAGLSLSTCQHIHLFWSHSVIPTGHLVLAGFIMFLLVVFSVTTGLTMVPSGAYTVPTGCIF